MITDLQFMAFLEKLAADQRGKNRLNLTEWEDNFIRTYMSCGGGFFLTAGRRAAIDRMWRKLGPELGHLHPLDTVTERPTMAPADPTGCEYLVRLDGRQQRCNEPATLRESGRLRYCHMHGEAAVKAMERSGRTLRLVNI
jgi:hypothetical protein